MELIRKNSLLIIFWLASLNFAACAPTNTQPTLMEKPTATFETTKITEPTATLNLTIFTIRSPAFGEGESISVIYTCNGKDVSPPLEWGDPPEGTQSFALIVEDISVGNFVHWTLFNMPPDTRSLTEAVPTRGHFDDGSQQGTNHLFELGYFGPCPMPGPNQYRFRLYAVDKILQLEDGVMKIPLKDAMKGHILAETEVIGVYP